MPPKKSGKKKKKSKEELEAERIAREEEERRLAEEQRQREEEERKRREEEERKRREEEAKRRKEELDRLKEEWEVASEEIMSVNKEKQAFQKQRQEELEWARFVNCDKRPRATVEKEVNTFITEYSTQGTADINTLLEEANGAGQLLDDLEEAETIAREEGNQAEVQRCRDNINAIKKVLHAHIDRGTIKLMETAEDLGEEQRGGGIAAQISRKSDPVALALFVNVSSKMGRLRTANFEDLNLELDLPRPVLQGTNNWAVRTLVCKHDYAEGICALSEEMEAKLAAEAGVVGSGSAGGPSRIRSASRKKVRSTSATRSRPGSAISIASSSAASQPDNEGGKDGEGEQKEDALGSASQGKTPRSARPKQRMMTLGPVFHIELIQKPPAPKKVKQWTIQSVPLLPQSVRRLPHPQESLGDQAQSGAVKVRYTVGKDVIVPPQPVIAWWNNRSHQWETDGIFEPSWDLEKRLLSWGTLHMVPQALVQPRMVDLPYEEWSLVPGADPSSIEEDQTLNKAVLRLSTARISLVIDIEDDQCILKSPQRTELEHLLNKPMAPGKLLKALYKVGINLLPDDEDAYALPSSSVSIKMSKLEEFAYEHLGFLAATFSARGSKWNKSLNGKEALFQLRECLDPMDDEVHETDWRSLKFEIDSEADSGVKVCLVESKETDSELNSTIMEGEQVRRVGTTIVLLVALILYYVRPMRPYDKL